VTDSWAQPAFPTRPVTIVAPFTPGAPADVAARRVAQAMTGTLGQSVVVENRVGAGGTTGSEYVARAEPDGYTLIAGTQRTHAINVGLYRNLRYYPTRSFAPISRISAAPNVVVVPAALKIATMKELIALAKQRSAAGRPLSFGSGGSGTTAHLGAEVLKRAAGINMVHIPYRGTSQAMTDVLAGRVDMMFAPIVVACRTSSRARSAACRSRRPIGRRCCPRCRQCARSACRGRRWKSGSACLRRHARRRQ
jgi:tripartite-type tricarboxylate transporter receptor subunit TctC